MSSITEANVKAKEAPLPPLDAIHQELLQAIQSTEDCATRLNSILTVLRGEVPTPELVREVASIYHNGALGRLEDNLDDLKSAQTTLVHMVEGLEDLVH